MGHQLFVLTGQQEAEVEQVERVTVLPELAFDHGEILRDAIHFFDHHMMHRKRI